jgi:hypothetical protein
MITRVNETGTACPNSGRPRTDRTRQCPACDQTLRGHDLKKAAAVEAAIRGDLAWWQRLLAPCLGALVFGLTGTFLFGCTAVLLILVEQVLKVKPPQALAGGAWALSAAVGVLQGLVRPAQMLDLSDAIAEIADGNAERAFQGERGARLRRYLPHQWGVRLAVWACGIAFVATVVEGLIVAGPALFVSPQKLLMVVVGSLLGGWILGYGWGFVIGGIVDAVRAVRGSA